MSTGRSEMFSDGLFASAITLLALEIQPPEDTHRLAHEWLPVQEPARMRRP